MPRVLLTEQARRDQAEILDHLDLRSAEAADRFAVKFDQACELHARNPRIGASAEAYAVNLRCFMVWNYAIFYRPLGEGIEVIRVIHAARDIPRLFGRGLQGGWEEGEATDKPAET